MDLGDLVPVAVTFVVVGLVLAFGTNILSDVRSDFVTRTTACGTNSTGGTSGTILYTQCGNDYNSTTQAMAGNSNVSEKLPLLGLVIAAAIIIGVLLKSFQQ
jgi:hypothetical protein